MPIPLRALIIEDSVFDAELVVHMLKKAGYEVTSERVETADAMRAALARQRWDLITSDQSMPTFNAREALSELQASGLDIPFIVVSGAIAEESGVDMMIAGAQDYVLKGSLRRLIPAVHRELADAATRHLALEAEQSLREAQGRYKLIVESTHDAITRFDREARHLFGNAAALAFAGISADEYLGKTHADIGYPAVVSSLLATKIGAVFESGQPEMMELSANRQHSEAIIEMRLFPEFDDHNKVVAVTGIGRDISAQKLSEAQIWRQANFDSLTTLANRRFFYHSLEERIKQTRRGSVPFALLLVDLDKFKAINDTLGHAMGDQLLIEAARRMNLCVREVDTLGRLGGDEFGVLLSDLSVPNSIERVAQCILSALATPFYLASEKVFITASIGITRCPSDAIDSKNLLKYADQALFEAKHAGRGCYRHFSHDLDEKAEARMRMTNALHDALEGNEFRIHYQPIIDLVTGKIEKVEALIRWQHPHLGLVNPKDFIGEAERSGLIVEIGDWMFKQATLQQQLWRQRFGTGFQVSVNLSPAQFRLAGVLGKTWLAHLKTLPADNCLAIEITEGLLLDASDDVIHTLQALRETGIKIVIDDFGTGYSSLQYIKKFGVDFLKIDQSFVQGMMGDFKDRALCETIIDLAHKLGIKTIAEGVETAGQRDFLVSSGCDYAQGYLISVPLDRQALESFLTLQDKKPSPNFGVLVGS